MGKNLLNHFPHYNIFYSNSKSPAKTAGLFYFIDFHIVIIK